MTDHSVSHSEESPLDPPPSVQERRLLELLAARLGEMDLQTIEKGGQGQTSLWETEARYEQLAARLRLARHKNQEREPQQPRSSRLMGTHPRSPRISTRWGAALGLAGLVAAGVFFVARNAIHARVTVPVARVHAYATRPGERATLVLEDGSHVTLAPSSRLTVEHGFGTATRIVSLQGQAYFDAANTSAIPFIVRTAGVYTRVLGTRFDVRRYADDRETQVVVVSGKVAVGRAGGASDTGASDDGAPDSVRPPSVVLAAGMIGRVDDSTVIATTNGDATALTDWTSGRLVFRNTPVSDALRTLEHWYGLRFVLADSVLARQHLSATFDYGRKDDMLNALRTLLDVTLSFNDGVITVRPRGMLVAPASSRRTVRDSMVHPQASEVGR